MKKVLFVMDIQEDTTGVSAKKKPFPIKNHEELIQQINKCIHSYETEGDTVVYSNYVTRKADSSYQKVKI